MSTVSIQRQGSTLVVCIDRVAKRNAIDREVSLQIERALDELEDDASLRVGILTGAGGVFCAGSDLAAPIGSNTMPRGGEYGVIRRSRRKPLIAAVEGYAYGGGFELALACDLIVAARDTRFALPEATRGTLAASGGVFRAHRAVPRNLATELLLTGKPLAAERAHALGFVNRLSEPGSALEAALRLAGELRQSSPESTRATLAIMERAWTDADAVGWAATAEEFETLQQRPEMAEGIAAFFERRPLSGPSPSWPAGSAAKDRRALQRDLVAVDH